MKMTRTQKAQQVTWIGAIINIVLFSCEILAGIFGKSSAMIADGMHSLSDLVTDVIVIVFLGSPARTTLRNLCPHNGR